MVIRGDSRRFAAIRGDLLISDTRLRGLFQGGTLRLSHRSSIHFASGLEHVTLNQRDANILTVRFVSRHSSPSLIASAAETQPTGATVSTVYELKDTVSILVSTG